MSRNADRHPVYVTIRNSVMLSFLCLILIIASVLHFDEAIILWSASLPNGYLIQALDKLAFYINPYSIAVVTLLAMAYRFTDLRQQNQHSNDPEGEEIPFYEDQTFILLAGIIIALGLTLLLKLSIGRARPDLLLFEGTAGFFGFQTERLYHSMPSGHAAAVTAGAGVLFAMYKNLEARALIAVLAFAIIAGRVLLTEHYPSDVIAGFWLGAIIISWTQLYYESTKYPEPL